MDEYVLRLRADSDVAGSDPPIALYQVGLDEPIASHAVGYDTTPLVIDDRSVDPAACFTDVGLLDVAQVKAVGGELWRRLTPGPIRQALASVVFDAPVSLDLRSAKLSEYPWEFMNDSGWSLFTESRLCLVSPPRPVGGPPPGTPPPADHPLRMLVVVGTDTAKDMIQANAELVAIEAAAHARNDQVLLRVLQRPKPQDIANALEEFRPHAFHFIGHGSRPSPAAEPRIDVFYDIGDQHLNDPWKADRIRSVFRRSPPGLVVLNACVTAGAPTALTSLVQAFHDAGSTAVVAMMGNIRGDAARALSGYFYGELFSGQAVDAALRLARQSVRDLAVGVVSDDNVAGLRSNWPLPRLTVRGDVASAVVMTRSAAESFPHLLAEDFVTRWEERWRVWKSFNGTHSRLAVVTGRKDVGKSALLDTVAQTCARHGETVIKVDLSGPTTGNTWRDVLRRIAKQVEKGAQPPTSRLSEIARARGTSLEVITQFQAELANHAEPGGLLIVLDGLGEWLADMVKATLLPELCGPYLLKTAHPSVRMIVTMREGEQDAWDRLPDEWRSVAAWEPTPVGEFLDDEWNRALTHFIAHWAEKVAEPKRKKFQGMAKDFGLEVNKDGSGFEAVRGLAKAMRK